MSSDNIGFITRLLGSNDLYFSYIQLDKLKLLFITRFVELRFPIFPSTHVLSLNALIQTGANFLGSRRLFLCSLFIYFVSSNHSAHPFSAFLLYYFLTLYRTGTDGRLTEFTPILLLLFFLNWQNGRVGKQASFRRVCTQSLLL